MFRPGMKVVCVDATSPPLYLPYPVPPGLRSGMILTVITVYHHPLVDRLLLQFVELPTKNSAGMEHWYQASRFRPIVSRPTSIEFAYEIMRKASEPLKADDVAG